MKFKKICTPLLAGAAVFFSQAPSIFASTGGETSMVLGLTTEQGVWVLGVAVVVFFLFDQVLNVVLKAYSNKKTRRPRMVAMQVKTKVEKAGQEKSA